MGMVSEMRLRAAVEEKARFNYRGMHRYLITLPVGGGGVTLREKETVLAVLSALRSSCHEHAFEAYAYCFMPDRLVMIVRGKAEDADMKKFILAFRAASSAALEPRLGRHVWSRRYQERVLRKMELTRAVADQIFRLPVRAGLAPRPDAYEFQGSFVLPSIAPFRRSAGSLSKRPSASRKRGGGRPPGRRDSR